MSRLPLASALRLARPLPPGTLLADIGGTNARFVSIDDSGRVQTPRILPTRNHTSLSDALRTHLDMSRIPEPRHAAIAVACPVSGDAVVFTNIDWSFSISEFRREFGLDSLTVVNDAAAIAHALPSLDENDLDFWQVGEAPASAAAKAMVAPGTGLGVAGLVPVSSVATNETCWHAVPGEGGHVTLPAFNDLEAAIIAHLRSQYGHVSAERVISGPGLAKLHAALAEVEREKHHVTNSEELAARLRAGDPHAVRTFTHFADFLGTVAADAVLTFGATGGLYFAGGLLPAIGADFDRARFLTRFADKGRFAGLLANVPVALVRHPFPAFVGLAALLARDCASETAATG